MIGTGGASLTVPQILPSASGQGHPHPEPRRNIVIGGWAADATQLVDIFAVDVVQAAPRPAAAGHRTPGTRPSGYGQPKAASGSKWAPTALCR